MVRTLKAALFLAIVGLIGEPAVRADLMQVTVSGSVTSVDPSLGGTFSVGQLMTTSYVFDTTTAPRAGSTSTFAVYDALRLLNLTVGEYVASSSSPSEIQVDNNPPAPDSDRYAVVSRASDGLTGASVAGNPLLFYGFRLDDSTNSVFSTALTLPTSLTLSDFDNRAFFVFFNTFADPKIVSGTVTGLTVSAIPEPGALSLGLLGLGAVGLIQGVRRSWTKTKVG